MTRARGLLGRLGLSRLLGRWQSEVGEQCSGGTSGGSWAGRGRGMHNNGSQAAQRQQRQQAHAAAPPGWKAAFDREVSFKPASVALLVVGSALAGSAVGSQANQHWSRQPPWPQQQQQQQPGAQGSSSTSSSTGGSLTDGLQHLTSAAAGYLRSFQSLSQHAAAADPSQPRPGLAPAPGTASGSSAPAPLGPYFISDAAARAAPAVVNILVHSNGTFPTGSSGSGFLVDGDGTILTNAHVVADAIAGGPPGGFGGSLGSSFGGGRGGGGGLAAGLPVPKGITVTLQDGRIFEARLVSFDTVSDLAVLKVDSEVPLPFAKLGTSSGLRVGEWVVALGSPLHLQNSVTAGIVSCVDRKATELGLAGARTDYIQTDAAINKGNSGGPLVNLRGEVVGISAMKAVAADGVSFAIPIDTAVDVMRQLALHGRVIRPYAGMKMLQLNQHNVASFRRKDPNFPDVSAGILVPSVTPGSPADKARLKAGDIIVGYGPEAQQQGELTTGGLVKALGEHVGRPMKLRVLRPHGEVVELTITAQDSGGGGGGGGSLHHHHHH